MPYQGFIAELPLGPDGLTGNKNLSQIRITQLLRALNLTYSDGTMRKEGGTAKYNASAISGTPSIIGGWDWHPSVGVQRSIIVASDGKIYRDTGSGAYGTTVKSGLTVSSVVPVFVEGGKEAAAVARHLFIFTGKNAVQVIDDDGSASGDLASPPTDWATTNQPSFGLLHEGRLWGGGNGNDRHRVYASLTTDHEDFTTTPFSMPIFAGEGDGLVGGISFKGALLLWKKPRGFYLIDTSNSDNSKWRVIKISGGVGMYSPLGGVTIDDDILFLDQSGNPQLVSTVSAFGDVSSRNIGIPQEIGTWIRENANLGQLANVRGIWYGDKREAHFAIAGKGSTVNNRRLVIDFNVENLARFRWSDRDTAESLWLRRDSNDIERPVYGDDGGFVRDMDQDSRSHDGSGYNGEFQIPHTDFSHLDPKLGTVRKNFEFLELVVEPKGNWNLNVDALIDGQIKETLTFNMGQTGEGLGSFVLGTDVLAGDSVLNKKRRMTGSGRRLSLVGRNNGDGQDFSVAKFYAHFQVGDERL